MKGLLALDAAQLAFADAAVLWIWDRLGVPRRMVLRMALVGMLLADSFSEYVRTGRVQLSALVVGALAMALYHLSDMRLDGRPELQRALVAELRRRPFSLFIRLAVWPWSLWALLAGLGARTLPLDLVAQACFVAFMIGGDSLPPEGPRQPPSRRVSRRRRAADATSTVSQARELLNRTSEPTAEI